MRDVIIATFRSENCPNNMNWIATLNQYGRRLPLLISGATEEAVVADARRLWELERTKHHRETGKESKVFARLASEPVIDVAPPEPEESAEVTAPPVSRRGGNRAAGLIWMINPERTARTRATEDECTKLSALGWTRGGPRSKLVNEAA